MNASVDDSLPYFCCSIHYVIDKMSLLKSPQCTKNIDPVTFLTYTIKNVVQGSMDLVCASLSSSEDCKAKYPHVFKALPLIANSKPVNLQAASFITSLLDSVGKMTALD